MLALSAVPGLSLTEDSRLHLGGLQSWPPCEKPKARLQREAASRGPGEAPALEMEASGRSTDGPDV